MTNTSVRQGEESKLGASEKVLEGEITIQLMMQQHVNAGGEHIVDGHVWRFRGILGHVATDGMVWAHTRKAEIQTRNMTAGEKISDDEVYLGDGHDLTVTTGVRDALAIALERRIPSRWFDDDHDQEEEAAAVSA